MKRTARPKKQTRKPAQAEKPKSIFITDSFADGIVSHSESGRTSDKTDYAFITFRACTDDASRAMDCVLPIHPHCIALFQPGMTVKIRVQLFDK